MKKVILASQSPRRRELLASINVNFKACSTNTSEVFDPCIPIVEAVQKVALEKAMSVAAQYSEDVVIGADTIVVIDDEVLGKPKDKMDAKRMLERLSGRVHHVYTGVAICHQGNYETFYEDTEVTFYALDDKIIDTYIASKESYDKAGAYGIQGKGCILVKSIHGDYNNVVGLPVAKLYRYLSKYISM